MKYIKLCQNCKNNRKDDDIWGSGYISWIKDDNFECPVCQHKLVDTVLTGDEEEILSDITRSASFYDSMIDLKQKDPIEFQLKMSQFKTQLQQQKSNEQIKIRCPKCNSTAITTGARGVTFGGYLVQAKLLIVAVIVVILGNRMGDRDRKVVKTCRKMSLLFGIGQDRRAVRILKEQEISPALYYVVLL